MSDQKERSFESLKGKHIHFGNDDIMCPICGESNEVNEKTGLLNIRAYKVNDKYGWWSECLSCSGKKPSVNNPNGGIDTYTGWFNSDHPGYIEVITESGKRKVGNVESR
jgi:hypothetical protein